MDNAEPHVSHADPKIAYHREWNFSKEALIWCDQLPIGVNLVPLATELHQWLLRKGSFTDLTEADKNTIGSLTNPYSYHASVIASIFAQALNSSHAFATGIESLDATQADIERIRLYNEQVLYTTRFCEAATKQLLYCTQIPLKLYKRASLGTLLELDCKPCRNAGKPSHKISLLGSLAHRYGFCIPFELCLFEHLKLVNRRRNIEAAHSDTQALRVRSAAISRAELKATSTAVGNEFVHMLKHISDVEVRMFDEISAEVANRRAALGGTEASVPPTSPVDAVHSTGFSALCATPQCAAIPGELVWQP